MTHTDKLSKSFVSYLKQVRNTVEELNSSHTIFENGSIVLKINQLSAAHIENYTHYV